MPVSCSREASSTLTVTGGAVQEEEEMKTKMRRRNKRP